MRKVFNMAKTYAILYLIGMIGVYTILSKLSLGIIIETLVMITYWIFLNKFQIRSSLILRVIWNLFYVLTAAAILFFLDLSIPGVAIKLISKLPLIGTWVEKGTIITKIPVALYWDASAAIFAYVAGIIEYEELPLFERQILIKLDELRYR